MFMCTRVCAPLQEIGLFIEHCALDQGTIFMDQAIEQITNDVLEAIEPDDDWVPAGGRLAAVGMQG